jgi:DNA end-binding protein Ku
MRTTWNGSLSFGLVSIPVGLAPATKPAARQSDVSFRLLHRECATPIKQKRWCPTHDREVTQDEIVRGFEVTKGQFLIVEDADLEAIERADDSRSIEITRFVQQEDVDPIFFDGRTSSSRRQRQRSAVRTCCCSRRCVRPGPRRSGDSSAQGARASV